MSTRGSETSSGRDASKAASSQDDLFGTIDGNNWTARQAQLQRRMNAAPRRIVAAQKAAEQEQRQFTTVTTSRSEMTKPPRSSKLPAHQKPAGEVAFPKRNVLTREIWNDERKLDQRLTSLRPGNLSADTYSK